MDHRARNKARQFDCLYQGQRVKNVTLKMPSFVVIWIWLCAYLNCAGWTLSALHQLNAGGYVVALTLGLAATLVWSRKTGTPVWPKIYWPKLHRRFRRGFPLAFLILAVLAFLGGALHPANNYDGLAYRTPRVLHWLAVGHWEWMHTEFQRLNTRTAGFEWLTAPQFLFLHTDRLVFLINIISFLLLPGRFFAVLTRLGVRPAAAWYWMWLFAGGYGYVLQAGSVVNDMFGALFGLTAIEFALRARKDRVPSTLWIAGLAAGLMTSAKAFNILLLLPWMVAVLPVGKVLLRRPIASAAVIILALSASIVPTALMNIKQCGDWTGLRAEQPAIGGGSKACHFLANAINLPLANLAPPFFPFRPQWESFVKNTVPERLSIELHKTVEGGLAEFQIMEMQTEEWAGLGLGVTGLLLVVLARKIRAGNIGRPQWFSPATLVPLTAWAGIGVFMIQVGAAGPARYLLIFYPLLVAPVLAGEGVSELFRRQLWRNTALATMAISAILLILSPPRPLWPAKTVVQTLAGGHPDNPLLRRVQSVYDAYGTRVIGFDPVLAALPPEAEPLGYMAFDEPEAGLWRPFGSRRIEHFRYEDSPLDLRARGIHFALVSENLLKQHGPTEPDDWLARMQAETLQTFEFKLLARDQPHGWRLVRFR